MGVGYTGEGFSPRRTCIFVEPMARFELATCSLRGHSFSDATYHGLRKALLNVQTCDTTGVTSGKVRRFR